MWRSVYRLGSCCQTDPKTGVGVGWGVTEFVAPTRCIQSSQSGQQYQIITSLTCYVMNLSSADQINDSRVPTCANLCADYSNSFELLHSDRVNV